MRTRMVDWDRLPFVQALQGLKGVQFVSSMVIARELCSFIWELAHLMAKQPERKAA